MNAEIKLRPHHSLCIGFFEGKGYSDAFTQNMRQVISQLDDPSVVRLTVHADIICSQCPHNESGSCDTDNKAALYDAAVLRLTGLSDGDRLTWSDLCRLVKSRILDTNKLSDVCGSCRWFNICSKK